MHVWGVPIWHRRCHIFNNRFGSMKSEQQKQVKKKPTKISVKYMLVIYIQNKPIRYRELKLNATSRFNSLIL